MSVDIGVVIGFCYECGEWMFVDNFSGVSNHGEPDLIDYDADARHVAILDMNADPTGSVEGR